MQTYRFSLNNAGELDDALNRAVGLL